MNNFTKRILSGLLYVIIFVGATLYSKESYMILIGFFMVGVIFEFSKLINYKSIISYLLILVPPLFFVASNTFSEKRMLLLLAVTLACSVRLIFQLFQKKTNVPKITLDKIDITLRYVIFPFYFLAILPFIDAIYTPMISIAMLILIWVNDSFAFLVGKNFGKRKLFESISPKKTIEGFIGGLIFSLITAFVISLNNPVFSVINWLSIALITSVFGTIGDLVESKFKRQAGVKDSGTIMPGHGGLLDRLDSVLFVAPFVYLYIHYLI